MKVMIDGVEFVPNPQLQSYRAWPDNIRESRKARNDTLEAMARETGLSKTYLSELENREAIEPGLNTIRAILRYAGATFEDFFGLGRVPHSDSTASGSGAAVGQAMTPAVSRERPSP